MSYDSYETSIRSSFPIELFRFEVDTDLYLYTSQERSKVDGLDIYEPAEISHSKISFEDEIRKSDIKITCKRDLAIAQLFLVQPPPIPVIFYLYAYQNDDSISRKVTLWSGRIINAEWRGSQVILSCESVRTSLDRNGLIMTYGPGCKYQLYGPGCEVSFLEYELTTILTNVSGVTLTSPDFGLQADNYYSGGYIQYLAPGQPSQFRAIATHIGDTITIAYPMIGLETNSEINAYPGCAHDINTCFNKFANELNYPGFAYNPRVNPFGGTPVF